MGKQAQEGEHFACSQGTKVRHPAWTLPRTAPGYSPHPEGLQLVVGLQSHCVGTAHCGGSLGWGPCTVII